MMGRWQTSAHMLIPIGGGCRCPTILCLQSRGGLGSHGEIWQSSIVAQCWRSCAHEASL
jgi:hypothetical protein